METSPPEKEYDVFISFRGEDTRTNFTSHLHRALAQKGIKAYIDDFLVKGHQVWPSLSHAILNSHVAIVVFSKDYASSKWCLDELVYILHCRKRNKQVVIPVFHQVDPSDVRKQRGTYGEAFARHERELLRRNNTDQDIENVQKKVSKWRGALTRAANISGWDTSNREYKNESQVIEKIVRDVLQKLDLRFPNELKAKDLVGLDKIYKYLESLQTKRRSNQLHKNAQVIGIWGMGGLGKTTIAKVLFSQLFHQYDSACFLENVREASQNMQTKLTSLREKLLSELLKDEHLNSPTFIARRLSTKKVLIVLDDVDTPEQLEALWEVCSYGGPGSKLIITTRNKHLLRGKADEDGISEVKTWSFEESLELFCLRAFNQRYPKKGYEDLSKKAVDYAGGVPLALKVLGSILLDQSTEFWDSKLNELKHCPHDAIQNVLRVSYDGLGILQKKIFLDIAFFFKGVNEDFVERILNACDFFATSGLKDLEDKALITISSGKKIQMHDLVQDVALNVVRQGIKNPGKRSRLKDNKEVSDVLQCKKKGTDAVEGIKLDLSQINNLQLNANAFNMMTDLRFLKLYVPFGKKSGNMDYPIVLNEFSGELRYLEWHGYHMKSLPEAICTEWLVEIRLPHSHITKLWHGVKNVENLERLDLSECKHLETLPDLSKAKLKWVNLSGCESLAYLDSCVLSIDTLETLILDGCKKLTSLNSKKHLRSLKEISVNGCTRLKEVSLSSAAMERLDLNNAGIEKLHSSIGHSAKLKWLNLEGLGLGKLPKGLSYLKRLLELRISNCRLLVLDIQNLHTLFDGLRSLEVLCLKHCCNLTELPDNIDGLYRLRELALDGSSVQELPASIKHMEWLQTLSLRDCVHLKHLPELPANLKKFYAVNCTSLVTVSTLETFAQVMIGTKKYISFQNCIKLDEPSLQEIMKGAQLTAKTAVLRNVEVRRFGVKTHSYNYNFVDVCSPGSSVPEEFKHRTTGSSLTITLPSHSEVLGLILCAVLSPSEEMKKDGAKIFCQCYDAKGRKVGHATRWWNHNYELIRELNCDHVYIWYDAHHLDSAVRLYEQHITVEFYVTNGSGERYASKICTKECGAHLVFDTDQEWDYDSKSIRKLALKLGLEFGSKLERRISGASIIESGVRMKGQRRTRCK